MLANRASDLRDCEIAPRFGVSPSTVKHIRHRRRWAHLYGIDTPATSPDAQAA
jgi:hypothetical protein